MKPLCSVCKSKYFWRLNDGRLRCKKCRCRFSRPKIFNHKLVKQVISEFLLEHSTNVILGRVNISKYKLLKILTLLRKIMTRNVPRVFEGIVEVDETYVAGKWKNKSAISKRKLGKIKRGRGTSKQPVFCIWYSVSPGTGLC